MSLTGTAQGSLLTRLRQQQALDQPPTLKQRLIQLGAIAAPAVIGGLAGGAEEAGASLQGSASQLEEQQQRRQSLADKVMAESYVSPSQESEIGLRKAQGEEAGARTGLISEQAEFLKRRMTGMGGDDPFASLGPLSPEEQARKTAAINEYAISLDPRAYSRGIDEINMGRRTGGRVLTPSDASGTGVASQGLDKYGRPQTNVSAVPTVVPSMAPRTTETTQIVDSPQGPMQVPITRTSSRTLPGGKMTTGAGPARPIAAQSGPQVSGQPAAPTTLMGKMQEARRSTLEKGSVESYRNLQNLERQQEDILNFVQRSGGGQLTGAESTQFLANHLSMTIGGVKGARTGRDIIQMHEQARSFPQDIEAAYQSWVTGGIIPYSQAVQMLQTTRLKTNDTLRQAQQEARDQGYDIQVNPQSGDVRMVPLAQ